MTQNKEEKNTQGGKRAAGIKTLTAEMKILEKDKTDEILSVSTDL